MKNLLKHALSALTLLLFFLLATSSAVDRIHAGGFNRHDSFEEPTGDQNYLEKIDGTKVYGKKIHWAWDLFFKNDGRITIDGQTFRFSEIRGFREGKFYYGRLGHDYIQRVAHGALNAYIRETIVTTSGPNGMSSSNVRFDLFVQKGDAGDMILIRKKAQMEELLNSCPLALDMYEQSAGSFKSAKREDPNIMNDIFMTYNNGCKPVKSYSPR